MKRAGPPSRGQLAARLGAGLAAFAVGTALALTLLPEWQTGNPQPPRFFRERFVQLARETGFELAPGQPHADLAMTSRILAGAYKVLGKTGASWLAGTRTAVVAEVHQGVRRPGRRGGEILDVSFSLNGRPVAINWQDPSASLFQPIDRAAFVSLGETLARRLLAPGESFGTARESRIAGPTSIEQIDVVGSAPRERVEVFVGPPQSVYALRLPGAARSEAAVFSTRLLLGLAPSVLFVLLVLAISGTFLALLLRGRIDLVNGAILSLVTLVSADLRPLFTLRTPAWVAFINAVAGAPGRALFVFLVWSVGESLLRAVDPDFTTSLDTLRVGRLGPRGGRALLLGFSAGAALAGLRLGLYALATIVPGVSPAAASLDLPVLDVTGSPVGAGIYVAASVALTLALALRLLPARWARWAAGAAALAAGYALSPFQLTPFPVELALNVAVAGLLIWICRRHGLTALLTTCIVSLLLPALLFSALQPRWMPGALAFTAILTLAVVVLGLVGISRPEGIETGALPPPAFIRRLAEERRLHHEVDLLARMQEGLLPREMPRVDGWQIAARSVLAHEAGGDLYDFLRDEAGGLWIAAGDVAGHGYSCAIMQAMVKAGLVSLIEPGETPGRVLTQLDRVLRTAGSEHSFTSLALLRIDPATGEALLGNAGHPYPMVFAAGTPGNVTEVSLPGLPLGQGPARHYEDQPFSLAPASVLLLCSDGLFEALDLRGNAYGFERAREVLRAMGHRPPPEIVDALLNDCRRHLGAEEPPDDVTVVVVKRS